MNNLNKKKNGKGNKNNTMYSGDYNSIGQDPARPLGKSISAEDKVSTRKKYRRRRFGAVAVVLVLVIALSLGTTFLLNKINPSLPISVASEADPASGNNATNQAPPITDADWNFIGPVEQTINNVEIMAPDYRMISLPENGIVDVSYFNASTFIGDSITTGLWGYQTPVSETTATIVASKGISPKAIWDGSLIEDKKKDNEKRPAMDIIVESQPDSVYILMGANAMVNLTDEAIIQQYAEMLVNIRQNLMPGVAYYVQTITPVRTDNGPGFSNERIQALNDQLAKLAYTAGVYFIDLHEVLADTEGQLKEEYAGGDGYHLTPSGYVAWIEYLISHTAYHPRNQYLPGSLYGEPV